MNLTGELHFIFVVECWFTIQSAMILRYPKPDRRDVLQTTPMYRN